MTKKMKNMILIGLLVAITLICAFANRSNAAAKDEMYKYEFNKKFGEIKTEYLQLYEEAKTEHEEEMKGVSNFEVTYNELGYNLYDIVFVFELTRGVTVEYHQIYDIVDDEELTNFCTVGEERIETYDITDLYPELEGM